MTNTHNPAVIYLGDYCFSHPGEERFLNKLRRDLDSRGVPAVILANFHAPGNGQRQIDHLIFTPWRLVHAELKTLDPRHPVTGGLNGSWKIHMPDGSERLIERNPYRQAHEGTYAISDTVRKLGRLGQVPPVRDFFKSIDTVVCLDPEVPEGSNLEPDRRVTVVGYDNLLKRLVKPGPQPDWEPEHIEALVTRLGLSRQDDTSPAERQRRADAAVVSEYRRLFVERHGDGLAPLVPLSASAGNQTFELVELLARLSTGDGIAMYGPSGIGKTHHARHLAVELARRGQLIVWLRAGEYDKGRFWPLLARATAPFSASAAHELVTAATKTAAGITVIIDGINECPPGAREELLEELGGFTLRHQSATVITSTEALALPEATRVQPIRLVHPSDEDREAILAVHGASHPERISGAFSLPFELAIAAECEATLDDHATHTDLFDSYVRRLCDSEAVRQALRYLAGVLHDGLRSSMRISDAATQLGSAAGAGLDGPTVDAVLDSRLLVVEQGQVRFRHELLGRFLAAERLVYEAGTGEELGEALSAEHRRDLRHVALTLGSDPQRRSEALAVLAQPDLYLAAVTGELGVTAIEPARAAIAGALADATFTTWSDPATLEAASVNHAQWKASTPWQPNQRALLEAAGMALPLGMFVDEIGALLDTTDDECHSTITALRDSGAANPVTIVFAATYSQMSGDTAGGLAASIVARGCFWAHPVRYWDHHEAVAARLLEGHDRPGPGRLYMACLTANPGCPEDVRVLPDLAAKAWKAQAWHLRVELLEMVDRCGRNLESADRDALADVVEEFQTNNILMSSSIVEALVALERIQTAVTVEGIQGQAAAVLAEPDNPDAWGAAAAMLGSQFEDEDIVGPYSEAIDTLPSDQRTQLIITGARHTEWMWRSWAFEQLLKVEPGDDAVRQQIADVFADAADTLTTTGVFPDDDVRVHILGVRGWARFSRTERPVSAETHGGGLAWVLMDELICHLEGVEVDTAAVWHRLQTECPETAIDALHWASRADMLGREPAHRQLLESFPAEACRLLEWGLEHRNELRSPFRHRDPEWEEQYIVRSLGQVGDAHTAEKLQTYRVEPHLAKGVVDAIRLINQRTSGSSA